MFAFNHPLLHITRDKSLQQVIGLRDGIRKHQCLHNLDFGQRFLLFVRPNLRINIEDRGQHKTKSNKLKKTKHNGSKYLFNAIKCVQTAHHAPKHCVLQIQMLGRREEHEKLRTVRVHARVGHTEHTLGIVQNASIKFIPEGSPTKGRAATGAGTGGVASLYHKPRHQSVQCHVVEVAALAESEEVPSRARRDVAVDLHIQIAVRGLQLRVPFLSHLSKQRGGKR